MLRTWFPFGFRIARHGGRGREHPVRERKHPAAILACGVELVDAALGTAGIGREQGMAALEHYTEYKSVFIAND